MVVVDTDVVSALMHSDPNAEVLAWLDSRPTRVFFVTAVTEAEVRAGIAFLTAVTEAEVSAGIAFLPEGARRRGLAEAAERAFSDLFAGRVLPFDSEAARAYAEIAAARRAGGRPLSLADCQIAAIARSRNMAVATRNVRDFEGMGIEVLDPWAGA